MYRSPHNRVLVGFDVRLRPNVPNAPRDKRFSRASLDPEVWPSWLEEDELSAQNQLGYMNVFNLMGLPEFWSVPEAQKKFYVPVAFDLPVSFLETLGRKDHVTQIELVAIECFSGWELLGFDVVDRLVYYSALSSDHLACGRDQLLAADLNQYGLLPDYASALAASRNASTAPTIDDHAPFSPCGVWALTTT